MDPALDPPPLGAQPAAAVPAVPIVTAAAAAANPTPTRPATHNHPPYAEMITAALSALNERNGSSKRAISKYIETHYSVLPTAHPASLTQHLKRLKINGQLLMVKHSYKLSRSAPVAVNGAADAVSSDPAFTGPKRRPGRPPKPKPDAVQAPVPVFAPPMDMNSVPDAVLQPPHDVSFGTGTVYAPVGAVNGAAAGGPVRGRGRPPKHGGFKRGPGRPMKNSPPTGGGGSVGRGRGRPRKNDVLAPRENATGRPRGRPRKSINAVEGLAPGGPVGDGIAATPANVGPAVGGVVAPISRKRRGRPPKAVGEAKKPRSLSSRQPKKPRKLSGRPLGRPRKDESAAVTRTPDSQLLVAYLDLKAKLENLQSRVKQTVTLIKPSLSNEVAINALQELELVVMNVNAPPPSAQSQQPQLDQPQQMLPPQAQS